MIFVLALYVCVGAFVRYKCVERLAVITMWHVALRRVQGLNIHLCVTNVFLIYVVVEER